MDRSNAFVLLGGVGVGKSSLFRLLFNKSEAVRKTQAVVFESNRGLDTPGEFFSHPRLYHALIQTLVDVGTIVYVHDGTDRLCRLPPGLLKIYSGKRLVGVITKIDKPECDLEFIEKLLRENGFDDRIFKISNMQQESVVELRNYLFSGQTD